ncbi:MAG: beta-ketoacyl-[acyl-carrier-protein] synthase family protein [Candidatus Omnitrophica bacterium]|nr:beta-ketoacyl-[acyl-carrier-protein] synthase family protein [Candidatus Omnitrophota bacterium]MCM8817040.1 beta-ketoacyl-[acyl-carrier-protein] synthase family protein [Candidatus Omnitrophota bacterium]
MDYRVVITGIGVIAPNGIGKDNFWLALQQGKSGIKKISRFDPTSLPCQIAGEIPEFKPEQFIEKKLARKMARSTQFAIAGVKLALEDAGIDIQKINPDDGLISLGISSSAMDLIESQYQVFIKYGAKKVSPYGFVAATPNRVIGEIIEYLRWKAQTISVTAACATGTDAIGNAFHRLRQGRAVVAIAGSSDAIITPLIMAGLSSSGIIPSCVNNNPEKASRPFDRFRYGGIPSEGCGFVVLEHLDYALSRGAKIYGEIVGYGTSGEISSQENPSSGLKGSIKRALEDAGISYSGIDVISAHAPSDPIIDRVETQILKEIFGIRAYDIPVTSIKSMVGNPLGSAGVFQIIAAMLWFNKNIVTPTINYEYPDPECDLYYVPNKTHNLVVNTALLNCGGLGGTCSALICRRFNI